ncbi:fucose permease [Haloactinopolyspora alba]|uniref:Fucose permease n=1 Tax=Haloactinopolyspora alba TaxID=648780 RepID=A0A2P8DZ15_9ACTN|nr:MFS transporter [Haloactinopolyspora alba]PSL02439.1 fucose permease [Haloactinopolyspora alba]
MTHTDSTPSARPPARLLRARNAVAAVFAVNGLAIASWMARIPQVRDLLDVTPSELGRILLALAVGSIVALPTAGMVIGRIGAARTVAIGSVIVGAGLVICGIGSGSFGSAVATAVGLAAVGYGSGSWDVAMNVEGAAVERTIGRTIMPRFHAAFSLGTVGGAGLGAAATALDVPVDAHLVVTGAVVAVATTIATRQFLPRTVEADEDGAPSPSASVWTAWREPRTIVIGVMVMCFALIEGIANDWLALGIVDGYDVDNAVGAATFALFVTAMTIGRTVGGQLIDRFGRLFVLRLTGTMAAAGTLLVVFGGSLPVAAVGVLIWGLGASLGFPLGMSAASDDPARSAARVSVVASIGYTAFLAGPPILGWLGDHEGVLRALLVVAVAAVVGVLASPSARKQPEAASTDSR